jgi:hypothetical protein
LALINLFSQLKHLFNPNYLYRNNSATLAILKLDDKIQLSCFNNNNIIGMVIVTPYDVILPVYSEIIISFRR